MTKLWLISQDTNVGYDTYDSAVVCADNEDEARKINPDGVWGKGYSAWCQHPEQVKAAYIGEAEPYRVAGEIVISSFNAG